MVKKECVAKQVTPKMVGIIVGVEEVYWELEKELADCKKYKNLYKLCKKVVTLYDSWGSKDVFKDLYGEN